MRLKISLGPQSILHNMTPIKLRLQAGIPLIMAAGLLTFAGPHRIHAQDTNLFDCRPNASGDGWICESTSPQQSAPPLPADNRYRGSGIQLFEPQQDTSATQEPASAAPGPASARSRQ